MRYIRLILLAACFCSLTMKLSAQELFNWGYTSGAENAAQGTLTAELIHGSLTGEGQYEVTSLSGTWDESSIQGPASIHGADNLFSYNGSTGAFAISAAGIGFTSGDNNISFTGPTPSSNIGTENVNQSITSLDSIRLSESPATNDAPWEPSDLLALSACAGLAFQQLRRRAKRQLIKN